MNAAPSDKYGKFAEQGYSFQAYIPASDDEVRGFRVEVRDESTEKGLFSFSVPMLYAPRFGVDGGDAALLEQAADAVLAKLPSASDFNARTFGLLQSDESLKSLGVTLTNINQ